MTVDAAQAYLDLPADDRLETRLPTMLKRHAEQAAQAKGESLSQYVIEALAERVADDLARSIEWQLTIPEQVQLLKVLSAPAKSTPALDLAAQRAKALFGLD